MANILIIDDDGALLMTVRAALMTKGHRVRQAKDGLEGLDFANREKFDLVLTDANMPGGVSGFQLVQNLRKNENYQNVPIFFLTGLREKKDVMQALESGVDDYIVKPIDYDGLLSKVDHFLKTGRVAPAASKGAHATAEAETMGSAPVNFTATWHLKIKVEALNEAGLQLASSFRVPVNFDIELESAIFREIGITTPRMVVSACKEHPDLGSGFIIETRFLELSKGDARRISEWIRNAAKKQFV